MWTCQLRRIHKSGGRSTRLRNCLQWIGSSDERCLWDGRRMAQRGSSNTPLVFRIRPRQSGRGPRANKPGLSVADLSPVVKPVVMLGVSQAETVHFSAPTMLGQSDPGSPQTIAFEELGDSSIPLSPICVQAGVHRRCRQMEASLLCCRTHRDL